MSQFPAPHSRYRRYEPRKLNGKHHEILRLSILGYKNKEIAEKLGCTSMAVTYTLNSNLGRTHSSLLHAKADEDALEVSRIIRGLAPKAVKVIEEIMGDVEAPKNVRLNAATDMLDRAGYSPVKSVSMQSTNLNISTEDLVNLRDVALQRARSNGILVDVSENQEK